MSLPKFALDNYQFSTIIIAILVLMGIVSFLTMPRSEDPQISPAGTTVYAVYPGANPADVEKLIVKPIEEVLNELEDIKDIKSYSRTGYGHIDIEFLSGSDGDEKYSDVIQKVNSIRSSLPDEVLSTEMIKWTINDVKILQYALLSETATYRELEAEAERLEELLKKTPGIKKIETWAFPEQEVRVTIDMARLANMNIPLSQLIGAVQISNVNIPGGKLDLGGRQFNIQTSGSFETLSDIKNIVVNVGMDQPVYLSDVANVEFAHEDATYLARFNNKRAVYITASQKSGTNIFNISDDLKNKGQLFGESLPQSIEIETVFDQSESVSKRLEGFFFNLLQGLILVGIIVILAVGFRASIIVMLVIPVAILIGIGFLDLNKFGLQQMSIAGLVIALGLLVDNAIVVTENIARFIKLGYTKSEAALAGTSQIAWAVTSSTVTTILAFVPMMLMADITGDFIRSMPITVVFTLIASLWVSLTLTPYLSKKFMTTKTAEHESRLRKIMNIFIHGRYRKQLKYSLEHPKLIIISAVIIFILSLGLFPLVGVSFFPKAEKPQFIININLPEGTSLDKTNFVAKYVESVLDEKKQVLSFASNVGHGNPRIYYNVLSKRYANNHAQLLVNVEKYEYEYFNNFLEELREEFDDYPGAKIEVKDFIQGPPVEAPIAIKIIGDNLSILKELSLDAEKIFNQTEGTLNIYNPLGTTKSDLHIKINREKAGMYGIQLVDIDRAIRAQITGLRVSTYRDVAGKEYDIVVRGEVSEKSKLTSFDKIYIPSLKGAQIPLKQLASIEFKSTPLEISHYDLSRTVTLSSDVKSGYLVNDVTNQIINKLEQYPWPKDYSYYVGGELESQQESFGGMAKALIIAIVGIFGVLVLQFKSYTQPLIVFSAIPLAIIGSIITLLITGFSFSFTAFVGLTSLVGIVVNNSIILVDYSNQLRSEGRELIEAIKQAAEVRFMPIILTTATTIGGLLPLTLAGGTMWAPMGWAIIGGLLVSTILTLIVVPVLYKVFSSKTISMG
jgi:multidrug efflux pump subunit AcrB